MRTALVRYVAPGVAVTSPDGTRTVISRYSLSREQRRKVPVRYRVRRLVRWPDVAL